MSQLVFHRFVRHAIRVHYRFALSLLSSFAYGGIWQLLLLALVLLTLLQSSEHALFVIGLYSMPNSEYIQQTQGKLVSMRVSSVITASRLHNRFNPLKTKRRLLYLKTQFVPRSKHFSSLL